MQAASPLGGSLNLDHVVKELFITYLVAHTMEEFDDIGSCCLITPDVKRAQLALQLRSFANAE